VSIKSGNEIGKMAYGTGDIPFIRTSDIFNWELKADPKQGVSEEIYQSLKDKQDVKDGDILFVRDGTYLIGTSCLLTAADTKILYQSHISKIRVLKKSVIDPYLLLAALSSPICMRQIRAKQFTADIIDTLGKRIFEIVIPIPKKESLCKEIITRTRYVIERRAHFKVEMQSLINQLVEDVRSTPEKELKSLERSYGFTMNLAALQSEIMVPKYYDPGLEKELNDLKRTHDLTTIDELAKLGTISIATGHEVGKMAYGTGDIPFIRTSDISNWELKTDPKQGLSEKIYTVYKDKQDLRAEDIFVVRDGTYLVGTSCLLTGHDTKVVYCGGIYRIRVKKKEELDPYLLFGLLNTGVVKRQMRSKQFTRDVIDTLGKRLYEVQLPIPRDKLKSTKIAAQIKRLILEKEQLRQEQREIRNRIQSQS
jgi:restriction endonuclease S subunit